MEMEDVHKCLYEFTRSESLERESAEFLRYACRQGNCNKSFKIEISHGEYIKGNYPNIIYQVI